MAIDLNIEKYGAQFQMFAAFAAGVEAGSRRYSRTTQRTSLTPADEIPCLNPVRRTSA